MSLSQINLRHTKAARGHDLYETHPVVTIALLRHEQLPPVIWEPACGPGAIVRVLRNHGHTVLSTDLIDYDSPDQDYAGVDFTKPLTNLPVVDAILTNPPFSHAQEFVSRSLRYAPKVYMLLRLQFLESEIRHDWFRSSGLQRIHVFSNRLPMMHRHGWTGKKSTSTMAFAWFVFDREFTGSPQISWIKWEPQK